jgi:chromosomal replication initiation ATPase DnaA
MYSQSTVQTALQREWLLPQAKPVAKPVKLARLPPPNLTWLRAQAAQRRLDRLMKSDDIVNQIVSEVCAREGLTVADIISPKRKRKFCRPRHEIWWRVYEETDMSMPDIACRFGRSDHTTIKHGIEAHEQRMGLAR